MKNTKLSRLIKISLLAAIAYAIMYIAFPLPLFPAYLNFDFSDFPALLGTFSMGPLAGVAIELIKNLLHLVLNTQTGGAGELANFVVGSALAVTAGAIYKKNKTRKTAGIGLIIGTLVMTAVAAVGNYYVFMPFFGLKSGLLQAVLYAIIPFNLLKGFVLSLITFYVYKYFSPILHK